MKELTQKQKDKLWEQVCSEFPNDRVMQDVHFVRLVHRTLLRGQPAKDRLAFYRAKTRTVSAGSASRKKTVS
jgi:hypothetical protein